MDKSAHSDETKPMISYHQSMGKQDVSDKISTWQGYIRHDFQVNGREAIMIEPLIPAPGNPWLWRTEFFNAFPQADIAMLEKGWYRLYYRISDMYGCPEAIELMFNFQKYIVDFYRLKKKAVLFGFSRGGLYAFNYAAKYPQCISAVYLDAPVLDICSWPGGKGQGVGFPSEWQECLRIYGLDEESAKGYGELLQGKIEIVAKAGIPIILVAGDIDDVVPFCENGAILVEGYERLHGKIKTILKPGVGHHPHSLENPKEIVDYIIDNTL